ncbi:MAG: DNA polymerase III subunit gamma/tau [Candidatus Gastranaerophilales bacterium]|nr:DNA polymerase III subunit gamma/tau [Candidatus Gastranaerophilales bacterium]MCM1073103.1 DNA polymerase III subunit gamma/tau [Bacteroides sp.]
MSENYVPLYRKYRPQTLETLVGQEHIKKTLTSAIELGKISHAYLFTGPRGTGKTSTARILAKSLNCKNGPTTQPCGECESCKDIANSVPIDVIEIDAASNRKVEDTQSILEKVQYVPVNGKYKIYIIDEVHMLTNHAFNALLKTLEEPPENVIFILATTEVHKVLDTIKSRCQRFDFRRITTEDIVNHLRFISDKEKINISDDALFAIAKNSAGGMRDSISLLDQLSLLGVSKEITADDVNAVLGRISFDILFKITEQIISSSHSGAIEVLNEVYNSGNEPLQILTNLSEYFKNLLIVKTCSKELLPELTGLNEPQVKELLTQKEKLEVQQIVFLIERISYYIKEVKQATNQHLWLEIGMIDLANMAENSKLLDLQNRIKALEGGTVSLPAQPQVVTRPAPIQPAAPAPTPKPQEPIPAPAPQRVEESFTPPPISKKPDGNDISSLWQCLLANIKSPSTQALLKLANPVQISADGVVITFKNERLVAQVNDTNKKQLVIDAANAMFSKTGTPVTIRMAQSGDAKVEIKPQPAPVPQPAPQPKAEPKPVEKPTEQAPAKKPEDRIETDQEKMVMDLFDGKYVE